jgi:hypothetical protein
MILQLINSKNRVTFQAEKIIDNNGEYIDIKHELGSGIAYNPSDIFLTAACCLADNPSCKITGTHTSQFKEYCKNLTWLFVIL